MIKIHILPALLLVILMAGFSAARDEMQFDVQEFTLDNGLTFMVVERSGAPVFSGYICAGVGSANEKIGNIGSAHLLEHMMFKGSKMIGTSNYQAEADLMVKEDSIWAKIEKAKLETRYIKINEPEKLEAHLQYVDDLQAILDSLASLSSQYIIQNEFDMLYTRNGAAQFNASTGYDITNYYVSLPSNRLELWFMMESDRLKNLALREFFPERSVVSEERRTSVENSPGAKLMEQFLGTAFIAHPYQLFWEWQSEVNNLTREDIWDFFKTYYVPSNMAVAVVGDVELEEVKQLAEKYFGDIPPAENPEPIFTVEPSQPGERRVEVVFDAEPIISIGYHKCAFDDKDEAVFGVIERILGEGRSSRFYKTLVLDRQLCLEVDVYTFPGGQLGDRHPALFCVDAYPKEGISTDEIEKAVYEELEKLAREPVDEKELTKIKNNIEADFIWASYSNIGLAGFLARAHIMAHDWRYILRLRDKLHDVTAEEIQAVAAQYFTKDNRTVATLVPIEKGAENE